MHDILEAVWHDGELSVWARGHDPILPAPDGPRWGLSAADLRAIVGDTSADSLLGSIAREAELPLWLPVTAAGLVIQNELSADAPRWECVHVPALRFFPTEALDWLSTLAPGAGGAPGHCGESVHYWAELSAFVKKRIAGGQFYPDMHHEPNGPFRALWRLLVASTAEVQSLTRYARVMPGVCRAVGCPDAPPARDPAGLVESFLLTTADAAIRRDLTRDPFYAEFASQPDAQRTPERAWLSGLLSVDGVVNGHPDELEDLRQRIKIWVAPVDQGRATPPVQVRFTLVEPFEDMPDIEPAGAPAAEIAAPQDAASAGPIWILELGVLPLEREGEVISATTLWAKETNVAGVLSRDILEWRARLSADVKRAAETCRFLARVSETEPAAVALTTAEAAEFISRSAKQLRERGFSVVLPPWAGRPERELGLVLNVTPHDEAENEPSFANKAGGSALAGRMGLQTLLDFDWRVAVGGETLSVEEFQQLAQQQIGLVKVRGQWVELDVAAAHKAAVFLEKTEKRALTLAESFRIAYATGHDLAETGLPILGLGGSKWIGDLLSQSPSESMSALEQPAAFQGTLRPYQRRGLDWMAFLDRLGIGACLADDMGLGKTIQLIALLLHEAEAAASAPVNGKGSEATTKTTLIFAPTSVVENWVREINRFAPALKVLVQHGAQRLRGDVFVRAAAEHHVVITSYALAHRDFADLRRGAWNRVVLDEAQKIKNPSSAAAIAIRAMPTFRRIALTGTPIENHLSELWSIMEFLNPRLLGTAAEFRENFSVPIEKLNDQPRAQRLRKMIQPFVLRRLKTDPTIIKDLPEKIESREYCHLTPEQAALYEAVVAQMLGEIDSAHGIRRRGLILAALTRLKQICDHPELTSKDNPKGALDGRSGKCDRLVEMLEEVLDEGDAALVFTQYRQMGHLLTRLLAERLGLPERDILFLHGGVLSQARQVMVDAFQGNAGKSRPRIFILSLRAGGLGLNLTAANHVFHFDRWWNPAVEAQATDRAHRIGQTRKVQVHKFVCVGTVEERIDRLLAEKLAMADKIVGSGEQWLTNLSTEELRGYLQLSSDAAGEY